MTLREIVSSGEPLFELGLTTKTWGVNKFLKDKELNELVTRHQYGDWESMAEEDRLENEKSLNRKLRIFSSYIVRGKKIWIITEADRSATTILLPSEY